jgi:hypothetical protein
MAFLGSPRGHRIEAEAECPTHTAPNNSLDTHSRTRALREPDCLTPATDLAKKPLAKRSSCLLFRVSWIETFSFLPKHQSNRRNFARQRQTSHGWPPPFGQQSTLECSKCPAHLAGGECRTRNRALRVAFHHLLTPNMVRRDVRFRT